MVFMITNYKKTKEDVLKAYAAFLPIVEKVKDGKETSYDVSLKSLQKQAENIQQDKFLLMVVGEAKSGNTASNQSSLRNIDYNGKTWNIFNEFFWMSREDIYELATGAKRQDTLTPAVADDVLKYGQSGNRFVYKKLQTVQLSKDAKFILDFATAILIDTMKYREEFNRKHPEYHINSWDAGWYQIKALAKEYTPDTLKMFNEHYKAFEDRMRPLVYELGFLYE